jgi:hypothetical protein
MPGVDRATRHDFVVIGVPHCPTLHAAFQRLLAEPVL